LVKQLEKSSKKVSTRINSKYLIDLRNVVKYYTNGSLVTKVLKDVNLQIKHGEFVVILGPSGSGKTTLLNIISGMDTATSGTTIVANHNLIGYNSTQLTKFRRDNIGYIFQQYGLLPNLTVRENVEIGSNLQKDLKKRLDIDGLLKTVGIYEQRNKYPRELSGGQQQRVSISRSMAKNPMLIFGDEPTGAIDEEMSKQIMQLFVDINKKYKTTIIIVTHNPILADLATMTIKVANGKIDKIIKNNHPKTVQQLN
jgi:putative ABC transport system ATP-binding protein